MKSTLSVLVIVILWVLPFDAYAELHKEALQYKHGDVALEGYLVYDDTIKGSRPGILVVHDWMGLGLYAKMRADQLAELGYVAFAIDMYGKGIRPKDSKEASAQASIYKEDRGLMRSRTQVGLDVLMRQPSVDAKRVAAIGYCFGGGTVLELARSGADIAGVVSFHGNLDTPRPEDAENIKTKVLVLHGADDPFVPEKDVAAFQREMRQAKVDWQMVVYGGAVHSFSNPNSGDDPSAGAAYDERADKRSWEAMRVFFEELFDHTGEEGN
ncbi:MAG: dienelactone hydrolase family protein [Candidatus Zixiibacteriota bacterium]|nr:MAG: dienelactone hydrolase family protein [candidate division Zixibacteria bacterium]